MLPVTELAVVMVQYSNLIADLAAKYNINPPQLRSRMEIEFASHSSGKNDLCHKISIKQGMQVSPYKAINNLHTLLIGFSRGKDVEISYNSRNSNPQEDHCQILSCAHPRAQAEGHKMLLHLRELLTVVWRGLEPSVGHEGVGRCKNGWVTMD
jgi:hypothetical protein